MSIKNPEVVSDYIAEELSAGRLIKLSADEAASLNIHCSPIGIVYAHALSFTDIKLLIILYYIIFTIA